MPNRAAPTSHYFINEGGSRPFFTYDFSIIIIIIVFKVQFSNGNKLNELDRRKKKVVIVSYNG
jgi:hypothetical protein